MKLSAWPGGRCDPREVEVVEAVEVRGIMRASIYRGGVAHLSRRWCLFTAHSRVRHIRKWDVRRQSQVKPNILAYE